jgi:AbrB family looped-hinge helix DNA binding protein
MGALAGPTAVAKNGQVTVPKSVLFELGWSAGDQVMFSVSDDDPQVLTIVPSSVFERRYRRGEGAEKLMRMATTAEPSTEQKGRRASSR